MTEQPHYEPTEIDQAQRKLGLSDEKFGFVLGCSGQHVRRLRVRDKTKNGHRKISPSQARMLRALLDGYRPPDWPVTG